MYCANIMILGIEFVICTNGRKNSSFRVPEQVNKILDTVNFILILIQHNNRFLYPVYPYRRGKS